MKTKFKVLLIPIIIGISIVFIANCKKAAEKASYTCIDTANSCGSGTYKNMR